MPYCVAVVAEHTYLLPDPHAILGLLRIVRRQNPEFACMPFDGTEEILPLLQACAPLALADFVGTLCRLVPGISATVEGPGRAGAWWIELSLEALAPGVAWQSGAGFALYGPGPTLPEQPNAVLPDAYAAAQRMARMLRSWNKIPVAA